jgi:hypothetical protein
MLAALLLSLTSANAFDALHDHMTVHDRYRGSKPNVIIMFADDYGWGDVGHNNPAVKETVAIDSLAAGGVTLKDMHTVSLNATHPAHKKPMPQKNKPEPKPYHP